MFVFHFEIVALFILIHFRILLVKRNLSLCFSHESKEPHSGKYAYSLCESAECDRNQLGARRLGGKRPGLTAGFKSKSLYYGQTTS